MASSLRGLVIPPESSTPVPSRGTAESAAPSTSAPPARPPPSDTTARPTRSSTARPPAPPRPPRSARRPLPPGLLPAKKSYADTVRDVTALVNLAKTVPDLPSDRIIAMHQASIPPAPSARRIKSTVAGPTRRQILITVDPVPPGAQFPSIVGAANRSLGKSDLRVNSCSTSYGGLSLLTNRVATQAEIDLVAAAIHRVVPRDVPATAALPRSRSFLKVVDVPFFQPGSSDPITPAYVRDVMGQSHMASSFTFANSPRVMRNSRRADTATVWFDVADSQSGATAKLLIGSTFQFGPASCSVRAARSHPGVPCCQRCWRWGHSTKACRSQAPRCPLCAGPHTEAGHRTLAACCRGNPSAKPPQAATPAGAPCPHAARCVNCTGPHAASDRRCSFWRHRFDRAWLSGKGNRVALATEDVGALPMESGTRQKGRGAALRRRRA